MTKTKTLILESGTCSWRGCIFCGYSRKEPKPVHARRLMVELDKALVDGDYDALKIFSSGSLLDDRQFPREFRKYIVQKLKSKKIKNLTIESRPEFVTLKALSDFKGIKLTVAIGLEAANNTVLKKICKGITIEQYAKAVKVLKKCRCKVRTYLLVNLPFVSNQKEMLEKSVKYAKKFSDSIVLINLLPHHRTPLFGMWLSGEWKPLNKKQFFELTKPYAEDKKIELDAETFRFTPFIPFDMRDDLTGVGVKFIQNRFYDLWQDYISDYHETPQGKDIALFLPCSFRKPYFRSRTHKLVYKAIRKLPAFNHIHQLVISSPGVIPLELCDNWPFNAYEWDESKETPEIMQEYIRINKERIKAYLMCHNYTQIYAYFKKTAESFEALRQACDELGLHLHAVLAEDVQDQSSLDELERVLSKA